jgi:hypothetical protein
MISRRLLTLALTALLAAGSMPVLAQQAGTLGGKATDEAKQPYSDYTVQVRNAATGQIVRTEPLNATGLFTFANLEMNQRYLVELFKVSEAKVVCTEGPFNLQTPSMPTKTDVNIDCGKKALWLLLAAPAIGVLTARSPSGL